MHDAVLEQDIGLQHAGAVDELRVRCHGDGEWATLHGGQGGPVGEAGGVADELGGVDHVVGEHFGQGGGGKVFEGLAERGEGGVGGDEEGEVRGGGEGGVEGGRSGERAEEGG